MDGCPGRTGLRVREAGALGDTGRKHRGHRTGQKGRVRARAGGAPLIRGPLSPVPQALLP